MKYPPRIYYTETDKALMWDRWQKGESLNSIARHFGRSHSSIQGILARTGGIRPALRRRSRLALTLAEGEEISRGVVAGQSLGSIAAWRWCMNQFGTRTEPFGGPTYSPTIAWDSGLPSSAIRFNTVHPILASRFCDS